MAPRSTLSLVLLLAIACRDYKVDTGDPTVLTDTGPVAEAPPELLSLEIEPAAPTTLDTLVASAEIDVEDAELRYAWTVDGEPVKETGPELDGASFVKHQEVEVQATPRLGDLEGEPLSASTTILNSPPAYSAVQLDPPEITESTVVRCAPEGYLDADGDPASSRYLWTVDGAEVSEEAELSGAHFDAGQAVACTAWPHDGEEEGEGISSEVAIVGNAAPSATTVVISPAEGVVESSVLSCTASGWSDPDGDPELYLYSWEVEGLVVAEGDSLDGLYFDKDQELRCIAVPFDGQDEGAPLYSEPVIVQNTPPLVTSATLSPADPSENDTVQVLLSTEDDDDVDTVSVYLSWLVDGSPVSTALELSGAAFDEGQTVQAEVTPFDGTDWGPTVLTDIGVVGNAPPELSEVEIRPSDPGTEDTLSAVILASDPDGDPLNYTYEWTVDGTVVAATGATLSGVDWFDKGQSVGLSVTAADEADSATLAALPVVVQNTPPGAPTVAISPGDPVAGFDDLRCDVVADAVDPDGDPITYTTTWDVNGLAYTPPGDPMVVPGSDTAAGDLWTCTVHTDDGSEPGESGLAVVVVTEDEEPPELFVDSPLRGEVLGDISRVRVQGSVADVHSGLASLTVNGESTAVAADDSFHKEIDLEFGMNLAETVATDTLGNSTADTRSVLAGQLLGHDSPLHSGAVARVAEGAGGLDVLEDLGAGLVSAAELDDLIPSPIFDLEEETCIDLIFTELCFTWYAITAYAESPSISGTTLNIDPRGDGTVRTTATIHDAYLTWSADAVVAEIPFSGSGDVSADAIEVRIDLLPTIVGNDIELSVSSVSVSSTGFDFEWVSWLEDVVGFFGLDLDGTIRGYMEDAIEDAVYDAVPPLVEDILQGIEVVQTVPLDGNDYTFTLLPDDVAVDSTAIWLGLQSSIQPATWVKAETPGSLEGRYGSPAISGSGLAVALSHDFLSQAMYALWGGGLLDMELGLAELGIDPADLKTLLPGLSDLRMELTALAPPVLLPAHEGGTAGMQIGDIEASLIDPTSGELYARLYLSAEADLSVTVDGSGDLVATATTTDLWIDLAEPAGGDPATEAFLADSMNTVLDSLIGETLGAIPIPTFAGFGIDSPAVYATSPEGHLVLQGDLYSE